MLRRSGFAAALVAALVGLVAVLGSSAGTAHAATSITINLVSDFTATATLTNTGAGMTTVTITATSKTTPNSSHAAHIHTGPSCTSLGAIQYPLNDVVFDATGNGTSTTMVAADLSKINDGNHYINVHDTTMAAAPDGGRGIFCGAIASGATSIPLTGASGTVTITDLGNNQTSVSVSARGFDNDPRYLNHADHFHTGANCSVNGPIDHSLPLPDITADANGNAAYTTTLNAAYTTVVTNHYFNVHVHGMSDVPPVGYGITCANIPAAAAAPGTGTPSGTATTTAAATTTVAPATTAMTMDTPTPVAPGLPNTGHGSDTPNVQASVLPLLVLALALVLVVSLGGLLVVRGRTARR